LAWNAYPFETQNTTENEYTALFAELQDSGVIGAWGNGALRVSADASGMTVTVAPGSAIVRGHMVTSTETTALTIPAARAQTRTDRVILRLDPAANTIAPAVTTNATAASAPELVQTPTGIFEIPLALVTVAANVVTIAASAVTDDRPFVGNRVRVWSNATRPAAPRVSQLGFNTEAEAWEFWDGAAWSSLVPRISWDNLDGIPAGFEPAPHSHSWSQVTGKPTAFPAAAHTHSWSSVADRPSTFPPSTHTHSWSQITGEPSTFPPSSHSHPWSQISGKPSSYPPSSHSHSQYVTSGGTVSRANGSNRVHGNSPSGSGWYAVWCDGNRNFCKNVSSARYKQNIRDYETEAGAVLALRPVVYDMRPTDDNDEPATDQYGLIAEEVAEHLPEVITYDETGRPDAIRYDLLAVAAIEELQRMSARVDALETRMRELEGA
jgi:hypothetical protein